MYITLWWNFRGHPENFIFLPFSQNIDGFRQNNSQGLENFFIFSIDQNYRLPLIMVTKYGASHTIHILK